MHSIQRIHPHIPFLLLAALLPLALLTSCVSSKIVPRQGTIRAIREMPYDKFMEMTALTEDDIALVRRVEDDSVLLERYDDTLGVRWSTRLNIPASSREVEFPGGFFVNVDLNRRLLRRSLFFDGTAVIFLYWRKIAFDDSLLLTAIRSDPATGRTLGEQVLDRSARPDNDERIQRGYYAISPGGTKLALFGYDYSGIADRDAGKSVTVSGRIVSSDFRQLGTFSFDVPFSDDSYDIPETGALLRGAMVDDQGNFYQPVIHEKTQLQVFRYDVASGATRSVTAFAAIRHEDEDMQLANVALLQPGENGITGCAAVMDDDVVAGVAHARFDFAAGTVGNEWYHPLSEETVESMIDDDELDDFTLDRVEATKDGRVTFSLEYQDYYLVRDGLFSVLQYKHRDIVLLAFTADGKPLLGSSIRKDEKSAGGRSFTQHLGEDGMLRVVYPIIGEMLYLHRMPLAGAPPANIELAQLGRNLGFMMYRDLWIGDRSIILQSESFVIGGTGTRLIRMDLP